MPYIPRPGMLSPTTGVRPDLAEPPRADSPPLPPPAGQKKPRKTTRVGLDRLSMKTFEPDIEKVVASLFGAKPYVDPTTGALVLSDRRL